MWAIESWWSGLWVVFLYHVWAEPLVSNGFSALRQIVKNLHGGMISLVLQQLDRRAISKKTKPTNCLDDGEYS